MTIRLELAPVWGSVQLGLRGEESSKRAEPEPDRFCCEFDQIRCCSLPLYAMI